MEACFEERVTSFFYQFVILFEAVFNGLIIGATIILKSADKRWYILTCLISLSYLYVTVNVAGYWMVKNVYWNEDNAGYSFLNGILSVIMLALLVKLAGERYNLNSP